MHPWPCRARETTDVTSPVSTMSTCTVNYHGSVIGQRRPGGPGAAPDVQIDIRQSLDPELKNSNSHRTFGFGARARQNLASICDNMYWQT